MKTDVNEQRAITGTPDVELTEHELESVTGGRITNIRAAASLLPPGGASQGTTPIYAGVSISRP